MHTGAYVHMQTQEEPLSHSFVGLHVQLKKIQGYLYSVFSVRKSYYCQVFCGRVRAENHPADDLQEVFRDFPGGPMAKTSLSSAGGVGSIPGRGVKIPCTSQPKNQNITQN